MMRNNLGAAKRLRKELQSLEKAARNGDSDSDIHLRPTSPSSLLHWGSGLSFGPFLEMGLPALRRRPLTSSHAAMATSGQAKKSMPLEISSMMLFFHQ